MKTRNENEGQCFLKGILPYFTDVEFAYAIFYKDYAQKLLHMTDM